MQEKKNELSLAVLEVLEEIYSNCDVLISDTIVSIPFCNKDNYFLLHTQDMIENKIIYLCNNMKSCLRISESCNFDIIEETYIRIAFPTEFCAYGTAIYEETVGDPKYSQIQKGCNYMDTWDILEIEQLKELLNRLRAVLEYLIHYHGIESAPCIENNQYVYLKPAGEKYDVMFESIPDMNKLS